VKQQKMRPSIALVESANVTACRVPYIAPTDVTLALLGAGTLITGQRFHPAVTIP
jgi:hypothetical protein